MLRLSCRNSEISTHILERHVFEMIRETMLDPGKLRGCIETGAGMDDQSTARELAHGSFFNGRNILQARPGGHRNPSEP